jgi:Na+/H+ antiporter NhaD/arsenite permease-like protein
MAMVGAAFVIIVGILTGLFEASASFQFATSFIDFNTIGRLLGIMIIVAALGDTGVFEYLGVRMSKASKGYVEIDGNILCIYGDNFYVYR